MESEESTTRFTNLVQRMMWTTSIQFLHGGELDNSSKKENKDTPKANRRMLRASLKQKRKQKKSKCPLSILCHYWDKQCQY
jgi:hypothetical protein